MDHPASTSRPYDGPSHYEMSGGIGGFPPNDPSHPAPWGDRPPSSQYPVSGGPPAFQPPPGTAPENAPSVEQMAGPAAMYPSHSGENGPPPPGPLGYGPPPPGHGPGPVLHPMQSGLEAPMATGPMDVRLARNNATFAVREYIGLQQRRRKGGGPVPDLELDQQIRFQASRVIEDLSIVREEMRLVIKDAEAHRWRKWLIGGLVASVIPVVKRIFRRSDDEKAKDSSITDTEHAFSRSKELLSRIKDTVLGRNGFASMAFFVFAVLYVFSNEVSIMVAKTVNKRLRRLCAKVDNGEDIVEKDLKLLDGWRWRIILLGR